MLGVRQFLAGATALVFIGGGITMLGIRSISGDSVAEAFYQAYGYVAFGLAGIALLLGFPPRRSDRTANGPWKRCIECQEVVYLSATKCPFCTTDLIEEEAADADYRRRHSPDQPATDGRINVD